MTAETLQTVLIVIVGMLIGVDLALLERSNRKLRAQLLELATERAAQTSVHEITIGCDNSDAIAKLAAVELAAHSAAQAIRQLAELRALH